MKKIILFIALFLSLSANAWDDCPLDKPIKWIDNKCYTCDIARDLVKNSSGVPLDIMNELEMFCKCPADKPIFWLDGQCVTCDEARENIFKQKGKFSEQKMMGLQQLSYIGIMADIDKFCAAPKCSADKPALWTDGNCYTCSEIEQKVKKLPKQLSGMEGLQVLDILMDASKACPELQPDEMKRKKENNVVVSDAESCPENAPLLGLDGRCHTCDEIEVFGMSADKIGQCESVCNGENGTPKRYREGYYCMPKICPADKPLMNTKGICYSCDELPKDENIVTGCLFCSNCSMSTAWFDMNGMAGISCEKKSNDFFYKEDKDYEYRDLIQKMKIQCPADKPILTNRGECVNCFVARDIQSLKGCDLCSNRKIEERGNIYGAYLDCVWKEEE